MADVDSHLAGDSVPSRLFYSVVRNMLVFMCLVVTRVTISGRENIPRSGAFVLAPVHRSNIDSPLASAVTRRRLRFMGKDSLWRLRPVGWVLSALGGFPVSRGTADREALKRCIAVLEKGQPLVLFPEGTRQSGPVIQPLFDGAAYVAVKAGVPIIPVGIGGSERVMPKGSRMIRPHKCVMMIGAPIVVQTDAEGRVPRSAVRDVTDRLSRELQVLFDECQRRAGAA